MPPDNMFSQALQGLNMPQPDNRHKVFVSFHNEDIAYRNLFDRYYGDHFISKSVDFGDIDPHNKDEYIKKLIQAEHITDSSVVVALYGQNTWRRKHVDWELYAGLTQKVGGRSGLMVMILPTFPAKPIINQFGQIDNSPLYPFLHPRTAANVRSGFANLYFWPGMYPQLPEIPIKDAFEDTFKKRITYQNYVDLSHPQYQENK